MGFKKCSIESLACSAVSAAVDLNLKLIVVLTRRGIICSFLSKYRPPCKVLAATDCQLACQQTQTMRGIESMFIEAPEKLLEDQK